MKANINIDLNDTISKIDDRIYSSFLEHMGRAIYTGIYEKDHPTSDEFGFRSDVQKLIKPLNLSHIRYPGGNFLSGYRWEDGIGDNRPIRRELAWFALEPNWVGINEFIIFCKQNNIEPMIGVNLGTRGPQDAVNLLEYCNVEKGTYYSDLRRSHGYEAPYNIKLWCLGNEMDGPWQICAKTAEEYARVACETAKMMKWMDDSIELVACGSSFKEMPTFGIWEKTVLSHCYEYIDYLSLHQYYQNLDNDIPNFLSQNNNMDSFIKEVASFCEAEKKKRNSNHDVKLSFDEWNVWYHFKKDNPDPPKWEIGRRIEEEIYDFADALLVGSMLTTLINNCDTVKIACLAQLVNVIAPIMTNPMGNSWIQTIYYPFYLTSTNARGIGLKSNIEAPKYNTKTLKDVSFIDCAVTKDKDKLNIIIINKNLNEDIECSLNIKGLKSIKNINQTLLCGNLSDINTENNQIIKPEEVFDYSISDNSIKINLKAKSWNLVQIQF